MVRWTHLLPYVFVQKSKIAQDRNFGKWILPSILGRFPLVPFQTSAIFCCLNHVHGHRRLSNVWWRKSSRTCKRRCVNLTEICLRWRRMLQGFGVICPAFMTKRFSLATSSQMARWWSVPSTMAGTIRYPVLDDPFLGRSVLKVSWISHFWVQNPRGWNCLHQDHPFLRMEIQALYALQEAADAGQWPKILWTELGSSYDGSELILLKNK